MCWQQSAIKSWGKLAWVCAIEARVPPATRTSLLAELVMERILAQGSCLVKGGWWPLEIKSFWGLHTLCITPFLSKPAWCCLCYLFSIQKQLLQLLLHSFQSHMDWFLIGTAIQRLPFMSESADPGWCSHRSTNFDPVSNPFLCPQVSRRRQCRCL